MPKIGQAALNQKIAIVSSLERDRNPWRLLWREIADMYLPARYRWLLSDNERRVYKARNEYILDNTGTQAGRTLAAGMMNGITSPSRPWFKLRVTGGLDDRSKEVRMYLDEVEERMLLVFAESNFYQSLQTVYADLTFFGTGGSIIYEDFETVIRCYNPPLGEYCLYNTHRNSVGGFSRKFNMTVKQLIERFPEEKYWSDRVKSAKQAGGARLFENIEVCHLVEENDKTLSVVPSKFKYRELYWEAARNQDEGALLQAKGFYEFPGIFPRWELASGEAYGISPAMDALGDVIQLQHETKKKAQALDKMVSPPVTAPIELENRPTALLPNGITYISGNNSVKVEPIYTVNPPLGEMSQDIINIQTRIRETFHNQLFNMISQLETVRTAAEIDARREEKLVLLGGVLERFENEALDPAINRVYGIMNRAGMLPEPPEELEGADIEVQYVSILSVAQKAVATVPAERFMQFTGNLAAIFPAALDVPNIPALLRNYARNIGVKADEVNTLEEVAALQAQKQAEAASAQALAATDSLSSSAKNLSGADVGGGVNALQTILGG